MKFCYPLDSWGTAQLSGLLAPLDGVITIKVPMPSLSFSPPYFLSDPTVRNTVSGFATIVIWPLLFFIRKFINFEWPPRTSTNSVRARLQKKLEISIKNLDFMSKKNRCHMVPIARFQPLPLTPITLTGASELLVLGQKKLLINTMKGR